MKIRPIAVVGTPVSKDIRPASHAGTARSPRTMYEIMTWLTPTWRASQLCDLLLETNHCARFMCPHPQNTITLLLTA